MPLNIKEFSTLYHIQYKKLEVNKDDTIQTSRDGNAEGPGPETLSISPVTGGAPGRSLKRLPSLQFFIIITAPLAIYDVIHCTSTSISYCWYFCQTTVTVQVTCASHTHTLSWQCQNAAQMILINENGKYDPPQYPLTP